MKNIPSLDTSADGIEEGKRLIKIGGDRGLSLTDRLMDRLQRLAWRMPFHAGRLHGRHPLKLIAVADDPFLGDTERGNALLDGVLLFRGEAREIATLDLEKADFSRPFADYLHSFAWLRDLSTVAPRAQAAPIAEALVRLWIAAHGEKVSDTAWRADLWGWRILFWVAHAPLILSSTDLVYRSSVLHALARGARYLERSADRVAPGPERIAAWCGVVAAGLLIPGGDPRRSFGEAGLQRALGVSMFGDGGSVSRSPKGQLDSIMLLTQLRGAYNARRLDPPEFVSASLSRMVAPLLGICHGDKGLGSWQGSVPLSGETVSAIVDASGVRTRPLRQSREWGYQRLSQGSTVVMIDAAPPPVSSPGACASTLAFELSDGPNRIVVNCGGGGMLHAAAPAVLGEALRTSAAHSTLVVGDSNSTAILADGALGRGVSQVELSRQETENASRIEASHDGYVRRFGLVHRRQISISAEGRDVRGEDALVPVGKQKARGDTPFAIRFHLSPSITITPTADGQAALLRTPDGTMWQFRCRGGTLAIEDSIWIDGKGKPVPGEQLVVTGEAPPGGTALSWVFHRAR